MYRLLNLRMRKTLNSVLSNLVATARNASLKILPRGRRPKFKKVWLDFHNRCNYTCIFCNVHKLPQQTLRLKDFKNFNEILLLGEEFDITGYGEFLTHPDASLVMKKLTDSKKKFTLVSNGALLHKNNVKLLELSSIDTLSISLNSLQNDIYERLTGNKLEPVLKNIEYLLSQPRHFKVKFTFVITAYNISELKSFIDFGRKYQAHITFYGLIPTIKDYPQGLQLDNNDENRRKLSDAVAYAKDVGVDLLSFDINASRDEHDNMFDASLVSLNEKIKKCHVIFSDVFISTQGDVTPCCYLQKRMGNIRESTLIEIWHGKEYRELRSCIARGDLKYCGNCRMFG